MGSSLGVGALGVGARRIQLVQQEQERQRHDAMIAKADPLAERADVRSTRCVRPRRLHRTPSARLALPGGRSTLTNTKFTG
jgi:hypothetical protein